MFSSLCRIWPAKATDKSIGVVAALCFLGLLLAKFILPPHTPTLLAPLYTLIFSCLGWIAFQRPLWGIIVIVASLPVERLLPPVPFATSLYPVFGVCTLAGYIVHALLVQRLKPVFTWTHFLGFSFLLWIALSNPKAAFVSGSRVWFLTFFQLFVFMFLTTQLVRKSHEQRVLLIAFVASCVISALFAIPQVHYGLDSSTSLRAVGLAGGPNGAARLYIAAILSLSFLAMTSSHSIARYILFVGVVLLFAGVAATVSRTGLLLCFLTTTLLLLSPGIQLKRIKTEFFVVILLSAIVVVPLEYWRIASGIFASILTGTDSIGFRYMQWTAGAQMWNEHFWSGVGVGQFRAQLPFYGLQFIPFYGIGYIPHSVLIALLTETGIVGTMLFLAMICSTLVFLIISIQNARTKISALRPYFWFGILFLVVLGGSTGDMQDSKLLWFVLGIGGFSFTPVLYAQYGRTVLNKWNIQQSPVIHPNYGNIRERIRQAWKTHL